MTYVPDVSHQNTRSLRISFVISTTATIMMSCFESQGPSFKRVDDHRYLNSLFIFTARISIFSKSSYLAHHSLKFSSTLSTFFIPKFHTITSMSSSPSGVYGGDVPSINEGALYTPPTVTAFVCRGDATSVVEA